MSSEPQNQNNNVRKNSPLLLLTPTLSIYVFFVISLIYLLVISFYRFVPVTLWDPTFTLDNYITYLSDPFYLNYIWVTLKISAECTLIALVASYPVAYYIARMENAFLKSVLFIIIVVSNFTNVIVRMYSWLVILQEGGVINDLLLTIGIISQPLRLTYNELGVIIGMVNWVLPFTIFSLVGSIQNINPEIELAAQSLGANKLVTFLKVTLPLSIPGILAAVLITFMGEITSFAIPMVMGGGRISFISNLIYQKIIYAANFPFGATASMILLVVTLVIGYSFNKVLSRRMKGI